MKSLLFILQIFAFACACPNGWFEVQRPSGFRCLGVLPAGPNVGYDQARDLCKKIGGVLSGIESQYELNLLLAMADQNGITGSVWIGSRRYNACVNKKLSATCSQTTSFKWTDGITVGTDGFYWLDSSQPDNAHGAKQNCLVAFFASSNVVYKGVTWRTGAMDDVRCDGSEFDKNGPRRVGGYVCGMAP